MKKKAVFCVLLAGGILMAGCQNKQNTVVMDMTAAARMKEAENGTGMK